MATPPDFECLISIPTPSESAIRRALQKALPEFHWEEGDSSWDKIRVWGEKPGAIIRVYRYESPGPFQLTIRLSPAEAAAYPDLRDQVTRALGAELCRPGPPA